MRDTHSQFALAPLTRCDYNRHSSRPAGHAVAAELLLQHEIMQLRA